MGFLDVDSYKPCPECGSATIQEEGKLLVKRVYCEECGHEPDRSDVLKSPKEAAAEAMYGVKHDDISDPKLRQQVKDRRDEGWEIEEVTDSGKRVVMSTTKGGTVGGHALTGVLTGLWTFGLGNVAYGKMSKKRNKQRIVLRVDDGSNSLDKESKENDPVKLIRELKQLNDDGLITDDEFEEKKQELLDNV